MYNFTKRGGIELFKKVKAIETLCLDGYESGYAKNKNYELKREDNIVSLYSKGKEICKLVITWYQQGYVESIDISNRFEANAVTTFVQYFGLTTEYEWTKEGIVEK